MGPDIQDENAQTTDEEKQKELREQLLRLAAEFDNYKKRTRLDVENAASVGKANLAKELLPIIDEFELALIAASRSEDKVLAKGIEMLYSNLLDVMKRNGLTVIHTDGKFDPYRHEIVMVKEDGSSQDGMILEVMKKGYMFKEMMLRPASVIIAKSPAQDESTDKEE